MTASPEMLIGMMVVLFLLALGLVTYLVRGWLKRKPKEAPPPPISDSEVAGKVSAVATPAEGSLTDSSAKPTAASPSTERSSEIGHRTPPPPQAPAVEPTEKSPHLGDVLLMKVWQDNEGFLVVEVAGERYRRLFEIRDGTVGRRLLETINRLVAFSKGQESRAPTVPTSPAVSSSSPSSVEAMRRAISEELHQQVEGLPRQSRISADPVPFRRRSDSQRLSITLNLADEIDRLLQLRVAASPEFSQRRLCVANTPDGGLRFEVDGVHYNSLDEIPEPQVKTLIRAAIADWEATR